jgi:sugar phosphate isomerase/epimerase
MKISNARNFGVQSYCFRQTKDNAAVAAKVREIDLDCIEVCAVHADFNDPSGWKEIVNTYKDAGVSICSIGVQTFTGAESERAWFESAAAAGARHISAHFKIDTFATAVPQVRKWCEDFDIRVGIHCHGGYLFGGQPDVLDYLIKLGGPQIGLCLDTAWCMQIGPKRGNPVEWAKKYAGHIYGVHYKDFLFGEDAGWRDVIVGEGNLDLPAFVEALEEGGFDGMAIIEYEADPENPVPALKTCVQTMRRLS